MCFIAGNDKCLDYDSFYFLKEKDEDPIGERTDLAETCSPEGNFCRIESICGRWISISMILCSP